MHLCYQRIIKVIFLIFGRFVKTRKKVFQHTNIISMYKFIVHHFITICHWGMTYTVACRTSRELDYMMQIGVIILYTGNTYYYIIWTSDMPYKNNIKTRYRTSYTNDIPIYKVYII